MKKFFTKYGYFIEDGSEYIITSPKTPKPWINVISNEEYGLTISQVGGGFSWLTHSELNRINRWHQDLVQDNWGKFIYVKNELTGEFWSPTWLPVKTELDHFQCIHGIGYTRFVSEYKGIKIEYTIFVPFNDTLEIWDIKVSNNTGKQVNLSLFTYFEWCLGTSADHHREFHKNFIETEFDEKLNSIIAGKRLWEVALGDKGHWNIEYPYKSFFASNKKVSSFEGDKETFLGNYGSLNQPSAVITGNLTRKTGAWHDPIASLRVNINLSNKKSERLAFYLGLKENRENIEKTLTNYKTDEQIDKAFSQVKSKWEKLLGTLSVDTPDQALNFMVNKWLRYQAISCRLWGRTAYYQQSGAYGFRDQLQDSLVFLPIDPTLTEKQIKLHARHQLADGTVLHWWHPITEIGLETKMTDDLLWLPFLIIHYLKETNNYSFLDEEVEYYKNEGLKETLFEHCCRAIDKVLSRFSERGLPLIGAGDWNDGLSAVGLEMKGESIWLAEFLYYILKEFYLIAQNKCKTEVASHYHNKSEELKTAFDTHAWDGEWFYAATKDNGDLIGSAKCSEGKIHLNPQSWAVISGIANSEKQSLAMEAVKKHLIKKNGPLLLSPAYSKPDKYIGYLTRYAAGCRENGGVYMHAATWSIWAFCLLKQPENAFDIWKRISPIYNSQDADKYKAEPYVTPGNIDGPDSIDYGMGGWTWYTGSAAWLQKIIVDWILGVRASEEGLIIDPCIPNDWNGFSIRRTFRGTIYNIAVTNLKDSKGKIKSIKVDGIETKSNTIAPSEKSELSIEVILG
ncbi:MAG: glycosyl transferase family 36 [Bacteroidetes bacterium]|nr:glycosyl transferase family 36 [Bacteroidota bacterium]